MYIELLIGRASHLASFSAGEILEVDTAEGTRLVNAGKAREVSKKELKELGVEAAEKKPKPKPKSKQQLKREAEQQLASEHSDESDKTDDAD